MHPIEKIRLNIKICPINQTEEVQKKQTKTKGTNENNGKMLYLNTTI
jgi:hypothetical protein